MEIQNNKLINFFKFGTLFFCISAFLWNCEIEDHFEKVPNINQKSKLKQQFKIQNITSENINNDLDFKSILLEFGVDKLIKKGIP